MKASALAGGTGFQQQAKQCGKEGGDPRQREQQVRRPRGLACVWFARVGKVGMEGGGEGRGEKTAAVGNEVGTGVGVRRQIWKSRLLINPGGREEWKRCPCTLPINPSSLGLLPGQYGMQMGRQGPVCGEGRRVEMWGGGHAA